MTGKTQTGPLVSIVLPTHNGSKHLQSAIDSCLAQTYSHFELIVVDDGSTDLSVGEILDHQTDPRVRSVRLKKNVGLPEALNTGFREVTGELLTWTSDDNLYRPNALDVMMQALVRLRADFVYAGMTAIDDDGVAMEPLPAAPPEHLLFDNPVGGCFLYTAKAFRETGWFDNTTFLCEDYDYWIRVWKRFRVRALSDDLYLYRRHARSLSSVHTREGVRVKIEAVRRKHFTRAEILKTDGIRAFRRDDLATARKNLLGALLRRPWWVDLYRPFAISALPSGVVDAFVRVKRLFRT
jgi:glycosyltransferase involved in cell wall biosynthesis